jgi:hypothetical protein
MEAVRISETSVYGNETTQLSIAEGCLIRIKICCAMHAVSNLFPLPSLNSEIILHFKYKMEL